MEGIEHGFRIGFTYECKQVKTDMKSALDNPSVVDKYLATEVKMSNIWASRSRDPADGPRQSFWGHHQPGKWRLIVVLGGISE